MLTVIDGMSEMLQQISFENGRVAHSNYPDHPLVRISPPLIQPAISNTVFAATGDWIRNLPITREGYSFARDSTRIRPKA